MKHLWHWHPAVTKHSDLSLGARAADRMKAILATWAALSVTVFVIATWVIANPSFDKYPYILLNLCLSMFAGLQCFVLLIANKRGEQIAAEIAQHTYENTCNLEKLLQENTELTKLVHSLIEGQNRSV